MKKKAAKEGLEAEMSNFVPGKSNEFSEEYFDLLDRRADKQEVEEAREKEKRKNN